MQNAQFCVDRVDFRLSSFNLRPTTLVLLIEFVDARSQFGVTVPRRFPRAARVLCFDLLLELRQHDLQRLVLVARDSIGLVQPGEFLLEVHRPAAKSFPAQVYSLRVGVTCLDSRDDEARLRQEFAAAPRLEGYGGLAGDHCSQKPRDQRAIIGILHVHLAKDAGFVERRMTADVGREHTMRISFIAGECRRARPRRQIADQHRESVPAKIAFQRRLPLDVRQLDDFVQEVVSDPLVFQPRPKPLYLGGQRQDSAFHLCEILFGPLTLNLPPGVLRSKRGTIGPPIVGLPLETLDVIPFHPFALRTQLVQLRELGPRGGSLLFHLIPQLSQLFYLQFNRLLAECPLVLLLARGESAVGGPFPFLKQCVDLRR